MAETTAKERVEQELEELNEKITKLSAYLYGIEILSSDISRDMQYQMEEQLNAMRSYAKCLQARLRIWGKTDAELYPAKSMALGYIG